MVIHLQDVKITKRRIQTMQEHVKKLLPDYTIFSQIKSAGGGRQYKMGVVTLLRNDLALTANQVPVADFLQPEIDASKTHVSAATHCEGRVLVIKTSPTGAKGAVWHINLYQYTSSAPAAQRKAIWDACTAVIQEAREQGAAVILGGNLNATTGDAQRARSTRTVDRACHTWIQENQGIAAIPS